MDTDSIIDRLGGTGGTAAICGVSHPAVSVWRRRGIPPRYWKHVVDYAAENAIPGITWDTIQAARNMAREAAQ